jgi:hypothetical protein
MKDLFNRYYIPSKEYAESVEIAEVKEARQQFDNEINQFLSERTRNDHEEIVNDLADAHEMQGWIYGFSFAMKILAACGVTNGGKGGAVHG